MGPRQAWGAFSLVVLLADVAVAVLLVNYGLDPLLISLFAIVFIVVYFYVLYKRYHVEVVPESDIALFDDPDDLRILCRIYGLDDTGSEGALRKRLVGFARTNISRAFAWVAPKAVLGLGLAFEVQLPEGRPAAKQEDLLGKMLTDAGPGQGSEKGLFGGEARSSARLSGIISCPVCDTRAPRSGATCTECGADLEFYAVLSESKVGRRLLSAKSGSARRKLRYDVPYLGGNG
ncbi:MAG: hypothetical protein A3K67_02200 [Euryarchaeota archaeon RBG_16_62_10]|nr:MAG: hypothetical protein A3K67_02200 [Euryarchaeota archaeon RBG_16_62_10]